MAKNTSKILRNSIIYSVYVRNHGLNGRFNDVKDDLLRIKNLGTDIIWFLPIHPVGEVNKKGIGCPYSIKDYTKVNEAYGTIEEFKELIDEIHKLDMKVMIDVVYNHTSHDAVYVDENSEFYYRKNGKFGNKVADWSDIIDLDYGNKELWKKQIDALLLWTKLGVDGFRCDVAPMVPMEFWKEARIAVEEINPEAIFLAESVHPHFVEAVRNMGHYMASDSETYEVFDICYDYDTHGELLDYFNGTGTLERVLDKKRLQEFIYPDNYVKLRFLENHDTPRSAHLIQNEVLLNMWTAFLYFEKGCTLIYAGQEAKDNHIPSLFEVDPVKWEGLSDEFVSYLTKLGQIKKDEIFAFGRYKIHKTSVNDVIYATYLLGNELILGVFNMGHKVGELDLSIQDRGYINDYTFKDGFYTNLIDEQIINISDNKLQLSQKPLIIRLSMNEK